MFKRTILVLFFYLTVAVGGPPTAAAAPDNAPEPVGEAAILVDANNGQVLFDKNADRRMYPASTTKIITALLALERSKPGDMVEVSERAAQIGGTRVGLQPGEKVRMEDLLYILMLSSANDAAIAIAEHVGGSVENFATLMNARAQKAGAKGTHFTNPHGMPDENHYTTARDMALISCEAMKNPAFRRIVGTTNYKVDRRKHLSPELQQNIERLERIYGPVQEDFYNHNKLIWSNYYGYKGANGIKTGYTVEAGQCIIASADRNGRELIAVVLKSQGANLWSDAAMLLDYGFNNFIPVQLVKPRQIITDAAVLHGTKRAVLETASGFYYDFPVGEFPEVNRKVELKEKISAPLKAGQKLAELVLDTNGRELGRVQLVNIYPVPRKISSYWWYWAAAIIITAFLLKLLTMRRRPGRHSRSKNRW
ncbi:D-alanyl-D-alanine carboxypeptidase family protein [Desulfotruncus alcoholivorax]|uniref:D-alanyl-D-alanine carboxypeptidase family protein n=1 Tax=Desulfotruncus alcoholivorax TaxID=265477 RepID=UPI00040E550B|nr:D-alanyl-D-alanine carboxypeptidase family protein [Desulfotruncus alcoholivorax]